MSKANRKKQSIFGITRPQAGSFLTDEELVAKQPKGTRLIKNEQTVLGGQYSGIMKSGKSVELSGDGVIPVPINATLGAEETTNGTFDTDTNGWNANSSILSHSTENGGSALITTDTRGYALLQPRPDILTIGKTYLLTFDFNRSTPVRLSIYCGEDIEYFEDTGTSGVWESTSYIFTAKDEVMNFGQRETNENDTCYFDNVSIKEIQQVQGSVTYFDGTSKEFVQVGADGVGSSKELLPNGDFSEDNMYNWEVSNGSELSIEGERLKLEGVESTTAARAFMDIPFVSGSRYRIKCYLDGTSALATSRFMVNDYEGTTNALTILSVGAGLIGSKETIITARDGDKLVWFGDSSAGQDNSIVYTDDLSIKKALPLSTTYDLKDGTYGIITKLHTTSFSDEDIAAFNDNPELMLEWAFGTATIPSGLVKQIEDKVWSVTDNVDTTLNELGKNPNDIITIEGTYSWNERTSYGIQTMRLELNDAGVPVSVIAPGSVYGEEYIETGFRLYPSDGYTVEEVTNLYTYAFTSEGVVWKDGMLYDSYTLPADGTPLTLGETLLNGGTVAQRDNTKVWTYILNNYVSPIDDSGDPLENHPYWYKVANDTSKIGWNRFGRTIVAKNHPNKNESQIAVGDSIAIYQYANATITAEYLAGSTADDSYLVPFCKILDGNNIVGARMRNGKVELIQKKSGSYTTLASVNNSELGEWMVVFDDIHIKVYINNTLVLEADSTITNFGDVGYFGISDYSWAEAEKEIVKDYTVYEGSALLVDNSGRTLVDDNGNALAI